MHAVRIARRRPQAVSSDLCSAFCSLYIAARGLSTTAIHRAEGSSNNATPNPMHSAPPGTGKRGNQPKVDLLQATGKKTPEYLKQSAHDRAAEAERISKELIEKQQRQAQKAPTPGGLASDSIFSDDDQLPSPDRIEDDGTVREDLALTARSPANMAPRLNPRPNARARWARMMVIRNVRRRGRLTREMRIARTERSHLSKSQYFKTSVKKLSPLARQIAGKSIDEAILQMRFSKKKAALEVQKHLIQARNEAIVVRGMGLFDTDSVGEEVPVKSSQNLTTAERVEMALRGKLKTATSTVPQPGATEATQEEVLQVAKDAEIINPANSPALATQKQTKELKKSAKHSPTDIYVAEAWVNRGPYGEAGLARARGRQDILRLPHTGISVVLKEEKTRTREQMEKEMKAVRKRMKGKIWTQLPDRPITRQSQYVLW